MDFHGHINLQENEMRQMSFASETDFPAIPVVGRIVYKGFILYMCVALNGSLPVWIPLTNAIDTYKHSQDVTGSSWTVVHNLDTNTPAVKVYDENNQLVIPDTVSVVDSNNILVTFSTTITGTAIVMKSDEMPTNGIGLLAPDPVAYTQEFTSASTIVVNHNLGYYPIVRAFINNEEVQPSSIIHDSIFQTTVTFSSAQTGEIRLT